MKRTRCFVAFAIAVIVGITLIPIYSFAQTACPVYLTAGAASYTGAIANAPSTVFVSCNGSAIPPPAICPPPQVRDPVSNICRTPDDAPCSESQMSGPINGKTLRRQCTETMTIWPSLTAGNGDGTDLGKSLGNTTWPQYSYSGYSPTWTIQTGYYLALQFKPTSPGGIQLSANMSYGDGGTISVSTRPGALSRGDAGFVCGMNRNGTNGIYISTAGGVCTVLVDTSYYLNLADIDASGNSLCYNARPNTCAQSLVSYTLYAGN